jgi:membrane associated rhomboid family serine protease
MLIVIAIAVNVLWVWLPEITIGLEFCTALIGFVVAVPLMLRRIRRWMRRRWRR